MGFYLKPSEYDKLYEKEIKVTTKKVADLIDETNSAINVPKHTELKDQNGEGCDLTKTRVSTFVSKARAALLYSTKNRVITTKKRSTNTGNKRAEGLPLTGLGQETIRD